MSKYIAQCGHIVGKYDDNCPICNNKIIRVWDRNIYTDNECYKMAENFRNKVHTLPSEIYQKEFIEQNRYIDILVNCFKWYDEHPEASDEEMNNAIRQEIINRFEREKKIKNNRPLYNPNGERCKIL